MASNWRKNLESLVGICFIGCAVGAVGLLYQSQRTEDTYQVHAYFQRVDGLHVGSPVKISGVPVGRIQAIQLHKKNYMAVIYMNLRRDIALPKDTAAHITSEGLMGGKFLALIPGGLMQNLKPGDRILYTKGAFNLESLIGQLAFSLQSPQKKD